uniref:Uncharacterized protein n=1 Tax=Acrobeloides nanus TaxID=290746 RepID=A0A914EDF6_9BILA
MENREDDSQGENQILYHKHQNLASFDQENKILNIRKRRIMDLIDSSSDETDSDEDFAPTDLPRDTQNLVYYYQSIEETSCIGKSTHPIDPEILKNSYRRIDRAIAQVIIIDEFLKNPARFQEDGLTFSCGVCFEGFLLKYGVQCEPKDGVYQLDPNQPSGSKIAPAPIIHTFCRPCIRGHAKATTGEMSLAEGCVGLRCMESGCKNAIFISSIRNYIPNDILTRLDDRIQEEILGLAEIKHLESANMNFADFVRNLGSIILVFLAKNSKGKKKVE